MNDATFCCDATAAHTTVKTETASPHAYGNDFQDKDTEGQEQLPGVANGTLTSCCNATAVYATLAAEAACLKTDGSSVRGESGIRVDAASPGNTDSDGGRLPGYSSQCDSAEASTKFIFVFTYANDFIIL